MNSHGSPCYSIAAMVAVVLLSACARDNDARNRKTAENAGKLLVLCIVRNSSYDDESVSIDFESLGDVQEELVRYHRDIRIFINAARLDASGVPDIMAPRLLKVIYKNIPFTVQIGDHAAQPGMFEWIDVDRPEERWIPLESIARTRAKPD